jgi:hypothetical protein
MRGRVVQEYYAWNHLLGLGRCDDNWRRARNSVERERRILACAVAKGSEIVRIPREQDSARDVIFHLASKDPAFLKSQVEMNTMGLPLDEVSTKTINEELEKVKVANERIRCQEEENFLRLQREREEKARAEQEKARLQHDLMLREQEAERQRMLQVQREAQVKREKEMKELEEQMRRIRIQEAEQREN